jgi:23S rRNA (uracil1939-C5)-methyltransferase
MTRNAPETTHEQTDQEEKPSHVRIRLDDMAFEGSAIGRHDGRVIFADYGIPGEEVTVRIEQNKRGFWNGIVEEVHDPSPHRVEPPCPYFGTCGGCQWQHIDYDHQIELKRHVVSEQLRRIGKFEDPPVSETMGAPEQFGYRNHARFSIRGEGALGFVSRAGSGRRFMPIEKCMLMHPWINDVLGKLQGRAQGKHQVAIRYGVNTGDAFVQPDQREVEPDLPSDKKWFEEELHGNRFRISGPSFFQTNTKQAERLADLVRERLKLTGNETVVDAYAGVGTFAVMLAPYVRDVIAIEESPSATEDAEVNLDGVPNVAYYKGKVEHILPELDIQPDIVLLDPSRPGCHKKTLEKVVEFKPKRIVYVSCNPATLARDLRYLVDEGYKLLDVTPVDMFPQTYHIESVSILEPA